MDVVKSKSICSGVMYIWKELLCLVVVPLKMEKVKPLIGR